MNENKLITLLSIPVAFSLLSYACICTNNSLHDKSHKLINLENCNLFCKFQDFTKPDPPEREFEHILTPSTSLSSMASVSPSAEISDMD